MGCKHNRLYKKLFHKNIEEKLFKTKHQCGKKSFLKRFLYKSDNFKTKMLLFLCKTFAENSKKSV